MEKEDLNEAEQRWANWIKASAESIDKHATQLVKNINFQTGLDITIRIRPGEVPEVKYCSTIIPERVVMEHGDIGIMGV